MKKISLTNTPRLILLMTSLTVLAGSCNICGDREEGRVTLTDTQKQLIPYKKGNVVSFTDRTGAIINLTATERERYWYEMELYPGGMCSDYFRFEGERIVLASNSDDFKIKLRISLNSSDFDDEGNYGVLRWDGSCEISTLLNLVFPKWNAWVDICLYADESGVFAGDILHESMEINNHVYNDVVEQVQEIKGSDGKQHAVRFFYNKTYGILQINVGSENFLTLNPQF